MAKKYLIINTYHPTTGFFAEESLEFILTLASLEYEFGLLFLDRSTHQLLADTVFTDINRNLLAITLKSFEFFSLKNIYIETGALSKLKKLKLFIKDNINFKAFNLEDLRLLYNYYDIVMWY